MTDTEILTLESGDELNAMVVRTLYNYPDRILLRTLEGAFGKTLYVVDTGAVRHNSSTKSILWGGNWEKARDESGSVIEFYGRFCPGYSEDIRLAWEIVEEMAKHDIRFNLTCNRDNEKIRNVPHYTASFISNKTFSTVPRIGVAQASSAPLAICRAFLLSRN